MGASRSKTVVLRRQRGRQAGLGRVSAFAKVRFTKKKKKNRAVGAAAEYPHTD